MSRDERHLDRCVVHVLREGSVALSPDAVMTAIHPVVAHEYHQRIATQLQAIECGEHSPERAIHPRDRGKVAVQVGARLGETLLRFEIAAE